MSSSSQTIKHSSSVFTGRLFLVPAVYFLLARLGINISSYISIYCEEKDSKPINKSTIYFVLIIVINFFKFTQIETWNFTSSFQIVKEAIVNIYTFTAIIKTQLQHVPIEQIIRSNPQILFAQSNTYEIIMCL